MRKFFAVCLTGLAILALAVSPIFAGENCAKAGDSKACAKVCGAKGTSASADKASAGCSGASGASGEAKLISADATTGNCKYMSKEECAKLCADGSKCEVVTMSVKGMTCGGCEQSITTALQKVDGVKKVISVSHTDGSAIVCFDPAKTKSDLLTTAVTNKGYEAQVIPAVATTTTTTGKAHVCSPENKAACASKSEKTGAEGTK